MQPDSSFRWTPQRHEAARLLAENDLPEHEIAERVGITRVTLWRWKQSPDFSAQVGDNIGQIQAGMLRLTIAKKHRRLAVLDDLHDKLLTVVQERAADYAAHGTNGGDVPAGGGTGLIVRQLKQIGSGRDAYVVEEFAVDTALVREIRATHEQAAKELGQWIDKGEFSLSGGIRREFVVVQEHDATPIDLSEIDFQGIE